MGQYQNLELTDTIENIPDELSMNDEFIKKISLYQLLRMEARYNRYLTIRDKTRGLTPEEAKVLIEDAISEEITSLTDILNNKENE